MHEAQRKILRVRQEHQHTSLLAHRGTLKLVSAYGGVY